MPVRCKVCGKYLNDSQYSKDGKYKSCPSCSTANGQEHVYYPYPESFGTTPKRATSNKPEGPQSYCTSCRGRGTNNACGLLCNQVKNME